MTKCVLIFSDGCQEEHWSTSSKECKWMTYRGFDAKISFLAEQNNLNLLEWHLLHPGCHSGKTGCSKERDCSSNQQTSEKQLFKLCFAVILTERRTTCTFWNLTYIRGITSSPFSCLLVRTMSLAKDYQWSPESDPLRVVLSGWITSSFNTPEH